MADCEHLRKQFCDECEGKDWVCNCYTHKGTCSICDGCQECWTAEDLKKADECDSNVPEGA